MIAAVRGYQLTLSPWLGRDCRYWPTCSQYAIDAVKPSDGKVVSQVTNGGGGMPAFGDSLTEQQIQDVAAYVSSVAGT